MADLGFRHKSVQSTGQNEQGTLKSLWQVSLEPRTFVLLNVSQHFISYVRSESWGQIADA